MFLQLYLLRYGMNIKEKLTSLPFLLPESISSIEIEDNKLTFKFPILHRIEELQSIFPHTIEQSIPRFKTQKQSHPKIKNIIAIASGKGGVGKSTITYYLALALQKMGAKVGVLDADIYGPSQSLLFNLNDKPTLNEQKAFIPFKRHGIEIMSIGTLSQASQAVMWRGPMISQALTQLYQQTAWDDLDYLLIDLPPGTGDIPLTLIQKMPVTASILISQPHPLAKLDVDKCRHMFTHLNIPIILTVQNQSPFLCPHCEKPISQPEEDSYNLAFNHNLQKMEPIVYREFINLGEQITQKLTHKLVLNTNPFDTISITEAGK